MSGNIARRRSAQQPEILQKILFPSFSHRIFNISWCRCGLSHQAMSQILNLSTRALYDRFSLTSPGLRTRSGHFSLGTGAPQLISKPFAAVGAACPGIEHCAAAQRQTARNPSKNHVCLIFSANFQYFGDAAAHHINTLMRTRRWARGAATARRHHASPLGARGSGIGKSAREGL